MEEKYFVQILGTRAHLFEEHVLMLGCEAEVIQSPEDLSPEADICLASGVTYFVKPAYLRIPRLGIWGFHESRLPEGRGRAPIHWTVLKGGSDLTVSLFQLAEKLGEGRLLGQMKAPISGTALLEDLRATACDLAKSLLDKCLVPFLSGTITPYQQSGESSYYRKRTPADSRLDIGKSIADQWDLLRVCDNEEYPAWFEIDGERFILKRYRTDGSAG